jgi:transcriptional regulator with XRE-family HTH domain
MDVKESTLNKAFEEFCDDLTSSPECEPDQEDIRPLFNQQEPNVQIKHERMAHRQMAWCVGAGYTQGEIAEKFGYSQSWVSQICRQEWFQSLVLEEITKTGRSVVDELVKNAAPGSVLKLIELRDAGKSEAVQFNASKELLNRYMGNTTTVIRHEENEASKDPVEEVERLEREAERLRASR